jgi:MFS family permease
MSHGDARLFTPRFFVMCGFSFTVFLTVFQLIPTVPFRIRSLGGIESEAGLFLGFLTFASAFSAPLTGVVADRLGRRPVLLTSSLALAVFSTIYGLAGSVPVLLALVPLHGVFWSGLLSASAAYMLDAIPEERRAEGMAYWGLSTIVAMALAPPAGFWLNRHGWGWVCAVCVVLNLTMAAIAARLPESRARPAGGRGLSLGRDVIEWRVLVVSVTLFLYSFGYGGISSFVALYAEANKAPKELYWVTMAAVMLLTRPFSGALADRVGHRRVFLPCLVLIALGLGILAFDGTVPWLVASAAVFGVGFGTAYPVFAALVMKHVDSGRRGAAFGGILAAFDTGIGTGSIVTGLLVHRAGFHTAFAVAAAMAALSLPFFLLFEDRLRRPAGDARGDRFPNAPAAPAPSS